MSSKDIVVARVLLPDDANTAGNVHGGTTLKMMEEAGMIYATRYANHKDITGSSSSNDVVCEEKSPQDVQSNNKQNNHSIAALVRFETMSFHKPILVGQVGSCTCEIIYTSPQSILVEVVVHAEDFTNGTTSVTNTGWLWYVCLSPTDTETANEKDTEWKIVQVPQMIVPKEESALKKYEKAKAKYKLRKSFTSSSQLNGLEDTSADKMNETVNNNSDFQAFKQQYKIPENGRGPSETEQILCQMVLPGDCGQDKVAFGGFIMKLMDNAAGCSAWRHCRTNIVTVAISDMDFVSWVRIGDLCTIKSKVIFVSSKSIEIEVVASVASAILSTGEAAEKSDTMVARGLFTFVSLGSDGKVENVSKLRLETEEDMRNAFIGQKRYEAAKKARLEGH